MNKCKSDMGQKETDLSILSIFEKWTEDLPRKMETIFWAKEALLQGLLPCYS